MNGWTTTSVWRINGRLVVADEVEEAIAIYRKYKTPNDADIETIERVFGDECNGDAITVEDTNQERRFAEQLAALTEENEKLKADIQRICKCNPPKWKKTDGTESNLVEFDNYIISLDCELIHNGYKIKLSDLDVLPKED